MFTKIFRSALAVLLTTALLAGCSGNPDAPSDNDGSSAVTSTVNENSTTSPQAVTPVTVSPEKEAELKSLYTPSAEDAAKLAEEKTAKPIIYSGFEYRYFDTPAKTEGLPLVSVTPLHSHAGLHNYIEQNTLQFDLGEGTGSFEAYAESYMDSFFADKGVLVISFTDAEGGGNYTVTGAWDEHAHFGEDHLEQLTLAVKKTPGESTAGHLIVELDTDFISLWDCFSIELYE